MTLDDFRDAAQSMTKHVYLTPEQAQNIAQACRRQGRPTAGRKALVVAAACFAIMAVSGAMLITRFNLSNKDPGFIITAQQPEITGETLVSGATDAIAVSGSTQQDVEPLLNTQFIPEPIVIGEYSEGYAPAQSSEKLWGYVDREGAWFIAPVYLSVSPIVDGQAVAVRTDNVPVNIIITH